MPEAAEPCRRNDATVELALGLLSGEERADALSHLTRCARCRDEVEQLAGAADRLLLLAPPAEPPAGFESRVLAAMDRGQPDQPRTAKSRRLLGPLLAAAAVAVVVIAAGWALASDRPRAELAMQADMITPSGRTVGEVRLEDGEPPWMLVSVPGWKRWDAEVGQALDYRLRVELVDGKSVEMRDVEMSASGEWGGSATFDPAEVAAVSMVDASGRVWCRAELDPRT